MKKKYHKLCLQGFALFKSAENINYAQPFQDPVTIPGYTDIIKEPMDLSTIKKRLGRNVEDCKYETPQEFASDVKLMLNNALEYNKGQANIKEELTVYHCAQVLLKQFKIWYKENLRSKKRKSMGEPSAGDAPPTNKVKKVKLKTKVPSKGDDVPPPPPPPPPSNQKQSIQSFPQRSSCRKLLDKLISFPDAKPFVNPDKAFWSEPGFLQLVSDPVALTTVSDRFDEMKTLMEFDLTVRRVFIDFLMCRVEVKDPKVSAIRTKAIKCLDRYEELLSKLAPKAFAAIEQERPKMNKKDLNRCRKVVETMLGAKTVFYFVKPVMSFGVLLPRYESIVKRPMDMSELQRKLHSRKYRNTQDFGADLHRIFDNAITYHEAIGTGDPEVYKAAKQLKKKVPADLNSAKAKGASNGTSETKKKIKTSGGNSLNKEVVVCKKILDKLLAVKHAVHFAVPVNWRAVPGMEDYPKVIKKPMDLGTIDANLKAGKYADRHAFVDDVRLVFSNCLTYNKGELPEFPIRTYAQGLSRRFEKQITQKFSETPKPAAIVPDVVPPPPLSIPAPSPTSNKKESGDSKFSPVSDSKEGEPSGTKAVLRSCLHLLKKMIKQDKNRIFLKPVNWQELKLLDYPKVVKHPMDFSTIKRKISSGAYEGHGAFAHDMRLVFSNCLLYNTTETPGFPVRTICKKLQQNFEEGYTKIVDQASGKVTPRTSLSFKPPAEKKACDTILQGLKMLPGSEPFRAPFEWKQLGCNSYPEVVKKPMDFRTIGRNLKKGVYRNAQAFREDMHLVFSNYIAYREWLEAHGPPAEVAAAGQSFVSWAKELKATFDKKFSEKVHDPTALWSPPESPPVELGTRVPVVDAPKADIPAPPPPPPPPPAVQPSKEKELPKVSVVETKVAEPPKPVEQIPKVEPTLPTPEPIKEEAASKDSVPRLKLKLKTTVPPPAPVHTSGKSGKRVSSKQPKTQKSNIPKGSQPAIAPPAPVTFSPPPRPVDVEFSAFEIACDETLRKICRFPWVARHLGPPVLEIFTDEQFHTHYKQKVSRPMDFQTVFQNLHGKKYSTAQEIVADVHLIFDNAIAFNDQPDDPNVVLIRSLAAMYKELFEDYFAERQGGDIVERNIKRRQRDALVKDMSFEAGKSKALRVLNKLTSSNRRKINHYFLEPFDWSILPGYSKIVSKPMDLGTIRSFISSKAYVTIGEFSEDVRLVFSNCLLYNQDIPANKDIREGAMAMRDLFEDLWVDTTIQIKETVKRQEIEDEHANATKATSVDVIKAKEDKKKRLQRLKEEERQYYMNRAKKQHEKQFGALDAERNMETAEERAQRRALERQARLEKKRMEEKLHRERQEKYMAMVQQATRLALHRSLQFEKEQKQMKLQARRRLEREAEQRVMSKESSTPEVPTTLDRSHVSNGTSVTVVLSRPLKRRKKISLVTGDAQLAENAPPRPASQPHAGTIRLQAPEKVTEKPEITKQKVLTFPVDLSQLLPNAKMDDTVVWNASIMGTCEKHCIGGEVLFLMSISVLLKGANATDHRVPFSPAWRKIDHQTVATRTAGILPLHDTAKILNLELHPPLVGGGKMVQMQHKLKQCFEKVQRDGQQATGELQVSADSNWKFGSLGADPLTAAQYFSLRKRLNRGNQLSNNEKMFSGDKTEPQRWYWNPENVCYSTQAQLQSSKSKTVATLHFLTNGLPAKLSLADSTVIISEPSKLLGEFETLNKQSKHSLFSPRMIIK